MSRRRFTPPLPSFRNDLGILAALLTADGINCRLAALPGNSGELLESAIREHRPTCALVDIGPYSISAAHRTIGVLAAQHHLPVVVCGQYATCRPTQAVSIPGVRALLLGEYDQSGPALMRALEGGKDPAGTPGAWVNSPAGLVRGEVAHLVEDLDSLPLADRELFDFARIVGHSGELAFKIARGCPSWCAWCVNDWYMDLYSGKGCFIRRRGVGHVIDEIRRVFARYGSAAKSVRFYDHCFAADAAWLRAFGAEYVKACPLPCRCTVPVDQVTPESAALLAACRCQWVDVPIGSGSRFIRQEILSMHAGNEQVIRACKSLRDAGLRIRADVFVGNPYESEITFEETAALLRKCRVDDVKARVFYPTPGTRAAELCGENGWISGRSEENYWTGHSVLDMPSMKPQQIDQLAQRLPAMVHPGGISALGRLVERVIHPRRKFTGQ